MVGFVEKRGGYVEERGWLRWGGEWDLRRWELMRERRREEGLKCLMCVLSSLATDISNSDRAVACERETAATAYCLIVSIGLI